MHLLSDNIYCARHVAKYAQLLELYWIVRQEFWQELLDEGASNFVRLKKKMLARKF